VLARSHLPFIIETQPLPNPLELGIFIMRPTRFHKAGVLFNHFTDSIVAVACLLRARAALLLGRRTFHPIRVQSRY